jgi:hypothetical protein
MGGILKAWLRSMATGQNNPILTAYELYQKKKQGLLDNELQRQRIAIAQRQLGIDQQSADTSALNAQTTKGRLAKDIEEWRHGVEREPVLDRQKLEAPIRNDIGAYADMYDAPVSQHFRIPLPLGAMGMGTGVERMAGGFSQRPPTDEEKRARLAEIRAQQMRDKVSTAGRESGARATAKAKTDIARDLARKTLGLYGSQVDAEANSERRDTAAENRAWMNFWNVSKKKTLSGYKGPPEVSAHFRKQLGLSSPTTPANLPQQLGVPPGETKGATPGKRPEDIRAEELMTKGMTREQAYDQVAREFGYIK